MSILRLGKNTLIIVSLILSICYNNTTANEINWVHKNKLLINPNVVKTAHPHHLLYDTQKQTVISLDKTDAYRAYSLSYTGHNILWYNDSSLRFGPTEKAPGKQHKIPVWITPPQDLDNYEKKHLTFDLTAAWINDRYFLISQAYHFTGRSACMLFDTQTKKWTKSIENARITCPEHTSGMIMENLQKNIVLITQNAEGVLLHNLWSIADKHPVLPEWNLSGGYIRVSSYANNPDSLLIASPCKLTSNKPYPAALCKNLKGDDTETLFDYKITSQSITIIEQNLPPYGAISRYDPGTIAWFKKKSICIKKSEKNSHARITKEPQCKKITDLLRHLQ
ncbi:hypothetical protein MNBD_GAMMA10-1180 [hydrothermal vent metagenome]|uniref:Uncharacterized protein n=1 Tax=hydrothermal vent metagenome TaxID=652676 RepID=A0A3B0XMY1_9ZZZZ